MNYRLLLILILTWMMGVAGWPALRAQPSGTTIGDPGSDSDPMVIHPQFRKWPKPAGGVTVSDNPPFFLWPVSKDRRATYDIRLSQKEDLSEIQYAKNRIPYAIYNPYNMLEPGDWYWQYRVSGGSWSDPLHFVVSDNVDSWKPPSPSVLAESIPREHPRLLIRKGEDAQTFRNRVMSTADTRSVITKADACLSTPLISEKLDPKMLTETDPVRLKKNRKDAAKRLGDTAIDVMRALTRAYLLTGDEKYARRGMVWALHISAWGPDGVSSLSDFGDSRCMLSMALAYDTFYDSWTEGDKARLRTAITARADRFYQHWINVIEAKVLSNHVWQHVYHYFFQTVLATYGDIPESEKWLEYLYELFLARAPALGPDDGAWVNGNSYFTMNMAVLLDVPLTLKDLTGFDFIQHKPWYQNNPYYLWYSFPPHSTSDGFGDNSNDFAHPNMDYIAYADALGRVTGNALAASYAHAAREGSDLEVTDDHHLRWIRLKYLQGMPEPSWSDVTGLARARRFPEAGLVYMHSNPMDTNRNLMMAMRSSPFGSYGHMLADQNAFNILYGGQTLFFHSGYKISMDDPHRQEWYKHTRSHNGILINDEGQPYSSEAYGLIPQFLDGRYIGYALGDASQAYHSVEHGGAVNHGLQRFRRHVLMLYPDIIVIYDELESRQPAEWSWLLHAPADTEWQPTGDGFLFTRAEVASQVNVYGATDLTWAITDTFEVRAENWRGKKGADQELLEYEDKDWHLKAISDSTRQMRYLAIIQVGSEGKMDPVISSQPDVFQCGDWEIRAELDGGKDPVLAVTRSDEKAAFVWGEKLLRLNGQDFQSDHSQSAKLVEMIDGRAVYTESRDVEPQALQTARIGRTFMDTKQN